MRFLAKFLLASQSFLFLATHVHAGEVEPRTYVNTPVGINFIIAGYAYSEGGLSFPAAVPIDDAELKIDSGLLAYARSLDVLGKSGKIDVILPYSDLSGISASLMVNRENATFPACTTRASDSLSTSMALLRYQ